MEALPTDHAAKSPEESANYFSKLFFTWTLPVFKKGFRRDLTEDDLYITANSQNAHLLGNKLEKTWKSQLILGNRSLRRTLWRLFQADLLFNLALHIIFSSMVRLAQPYLILGILTYFDQSNSSITRNEAYCYVLLLIINTGINSIAVQKYNMRMLKLGMNLRSSSGSLIYRKTLQLSKAAMNKTSTGQIMTLLSTDIRIFDTLPLRIGTIALAPLEITANFVLLYVILDKTAVVGMGLLLAVIPLQMYISGRCANYRSKIANRTDRRLLMMNEILSGIQTIKMYTWEKPFGQMIEIARKFELKEIKRHAYLGSILSSFQVYMSRSAIFVSILTSVLTGISPKAEYVFVCTTSYNLLTTAIINFLPLAIRFCASAKISCDRISNFLMLEEVEINSTFENLNGYRNYKHELKLTDASTDWENSSSINALTNIDFRVDKNEFVALIGPVGSGKSSLMHIILGELVLSEGECEVNGKLSYASQVPWLFKGTIRQNILFGEQMNRKKYNEVVRVCALDNDFNMFSSGDLSFIGEKGVQLSGGQKTRINLARAVYKEADVYLLDDPLSAVDVKVGKQLYDECIRGFLAQKSVLLITSQLQHLQYSDYIHVMEDGSICASGTLQSLQVSNINFKNRWKNHHPQYDQREIYAPMEKSQNSSEDEGKINAMVEKEQITNGSMSRNVYSSYLKFGGSYLYCTFIALLFVLNKVVTTGADYFITFWVNLEQHKAHYTSSEVVANRTNISENLTMNTYISQKPDLHEYYLSTDNCIYIYSTIVILIIMSSIGTSIIFYHFCLNVSARLHRKMFATLLKAPMRFFRQNPSGRILNRFSKDINSMDELLPMVLIEAIDILLQVVASLIVVSAISPWLTLPSILLLPMFYGFKQYYIRTSRSLKRLEATCRSPIYSHMNATLQGLATIRASGAQTKLIREFDKHQDLHTSANCLYEGCCRSFGVLLDITCMIYISIVALCVFSNETYSGIVGLAITQAISTSFRLQRGIRLMTETENHMTSVERILEYTEIEQEEDNNLDFDKNWPKCGKIEFKSVYLRYSQDGLNILKNLNFTIEAGSKIGIVGRTGAGKSSIVSALFRLAHTDGKILIDDVDIKSIPLQRSRSELAIIPQEPFLFDEILRKNLDPSEEFDDITLWNALETVQLKDLIEGLSDGLLYRVSEGGLNFSVGQRQLLCLARAICRNCKILILDEATANVDHDTDDLIQAILKEKFKDRTVITIAHRLENIIACDMILVMADGSITEYGHPYQLSQDENSSFFSLIDCPGELKNHLIASAKTSFETMRLRRP